MIMQVTLISLSIQLLTLALLLALSVKLIGESGRNMTVVFWSFTLALFLGGESLLADLRPNAAGDQDAVCRQ